MQHFAIFVEDLNSTNEGGKFESNYWDVYHKVLEIGTENITKI